MKQSALLRFFLISCLVALALGAVSLFALRETNESSVSEVRKNMLLFISEEIERGSDYQQSVQTLRSSSGRRFSGAGLWVLSENGEVLASSRGNPPVISWDRLKKPSEPHEFTFHYRWLSMTPDAALVKLDRKPEAYVLIEFHRPGNSHGPNWIQIGFLFFIIGASVLIAVLMTYLYLRRKSEEARLVLSRLEKGDLKARFEIKRFDEIGSLMRDFNRMASEIERLIHRVQETETARKNLLEELSHDLRTPLTSLNTSVETLTDHWDEMPSGEQKEFVQVVRTELRYFLHLIEDLFFIASIGEPRYKSATKRIDLNDLLKNELKGREKRAGSTSGIKWELQCDEAAKFEAFVLGDPLLIQRLFKNALDNAARHAASLVQVHLMPSKGAVEVRIENDGRTISDEEIESFGKRRKNRFQVADSSHEVSLGLGSVIMQAITELHGGSIYIMRKDSERGAGGQGTVLSLKLPKNLAQSDENTAK